MVKVLCLLEKNVSATAVEFSVSINVIYIRVVDHDLLICIFPHFFSQLFYPLMGVGCKNLQISLVLHFFSSLLFFNYFEALLH